MGRTLALLLVVVLGCAFTASAIAGKRKAPLQHVTIFGDSVAAALDWDPTARDVLEHGDRLTLELAPCGRLWTTGCFNPPPPSVLTEVRTLGSRIGPTAVVLVGYNDDPHVYAEGIDTVLRAMHNRGVKQVLWLTLREVYKQYAITNEVIRAAARKFPWMTVVDWAGYSRDHASWFASDGIHFNGGGAVQFAIYLHRTLEADGLTGPVTSNAG
ncbi:MAG TPA: hypothetical protein VKR79_11445 [Gaiellaceae bacterium]|nr:hypothetical protein [Gaiellaceae bacterium]